MLILAGITINALTGSDSAPARANEAEQKNDIGSAKDQINLTAVNAKTEAYDTAYVGNGVSGTEAATTIGQAVIDSVLPYNGKTIGKASIEVTQAKTNSIKGDATITITTRDFEVEGTITIQDGLLTWGTITTNVSEPTVDYIVLNTNSITLEEGAISAPITITTYDQNNQEITGKTATFISNDTSIATVDEQGVVTGVTDGTTTITVTIDDKTANCTVTVSKQIINFTIRSVNYNEEINLQAEKDMTWDDWISSSYYTTLTDAGYRLEIYTSSYGGFSLGLLRNGYYHIWVATNVIEADHVYSFSGMVEPE